MALDGLEALLPVPRYVQSPLQRSAKILGVDIPAIERGNAHLQPMDRSSFGPTADCLRKKR